MAKIGVQLYDLAVVLNNLMLAANDKDVGFEDADRTYNQLKANLSIKVEIPIELLESALWASTMLDEQNKFCHPERKKYNEFTKDLLTHTDFKFNRTYNILEVKNARKIRR